MVGKRCEIAAIYCNYCCFCSFMCCFSQSLFTDRTAGLPGMYQLFVSSQNIGPNVVREKSDDQGNLFESSAGVGTQTIHFHLFGPVLHNS